MKLFEPVLHLFTPRHTNNHKAQVLHTTSITTYIILLLVFQIFLTGFSKFSPGILGYASNITVSDLLKYTNDQRSNAGAGGLVLNDQLSKAAQEKAADMFADQYWAHTSPSGQDPWYFINESGYSYLFAGENLARDFGDSKAVVEAWMNSPTHKENLVNSRYQDVGFAVVNGKYGGYETTLVVQMFGAKSATLPSVEPEKAPVQPVVAQTPVAQAPVVLGEPAAPQVDVFNLTKNISLGLIVILLGVLIVDSILVYRRKSVRLSGHNFAHLVLLIGLLVVLNVIGRGVIL